MTEVAFLSGLLIGWFALSAVVFVALFVVSAPYGRHVRRGWGPTVPDRAGWVLMEAPAALGFAALFVLTRSQRYPISWVFLALWEMHYVHRAFIYPLGLRGKDKRMPIVIVAMAVVFNGVNVYLNGWQVFTLAERYPSAWLRDPRFLVGLAMFVCGYVINRHSDTILRGLRRPGESSYKIPQGGLYRWVSCPNYLGEIIEWVGWALATWSLAGLAFAVWTAANLVPRAWSHHRWYRQHFVDYPSGRRAILPGLL